MSTRWTSSELQFGALREVLARERQGALSRKAWVERRSTRMRVAERIVGRVSTRLGEGRGQLDRRRARGVLNPCACGSKDLTGSFLRGTLLSDHGMVSFYEGQQGAANGQESSGVFQGCTGLLLIKTDRRYYQLFVENASRG